MVSLPPSPSPQPHQWQSTHFKLFLLVVFLDKYRDYQYINILYAITSSLMLQLTLYKLGRWYQILTLLAPPLTYPTSDTMVNLNLCHIDKSNNP